MATGLSYDSSVKKMQGWSFVHLPSLSYLVYTQCFGEPSLAHPSHRAIPFINHTPPYLNVIPSEGVESEI